MFCTNCGKQNEEGQAFCIHCGSPMPQAEQPVTYCTNCGKELKASTNFCIHCGAARQSAEPEPSRCPGCGDPVDPGVRFCIRCGTSLQPATQTAPAQALPAESKRTGIDLLLICLTLVLTLVTGIIQWNLNTEDWFLYTSDANFLNMWVLALFVMPLLCLWACTSRKNRQAKCWIAMIFCALDLLPQLLFWGVALTVERGSLPQNLPFMAVYLSRNIIALISLFRYRKQV